VWAGYISDKVTSFVVQGFQVEGNSCFQQIGRKRGMFLGTLWAIFGSALMCSAKNASWMICARVITGENVFDGRPAKLCNQANIFVLFLGLGTGHLVALEPTYVAELSPAHQRGKIFGLVFLSNYLGVGYLQTSFTLYSTLTFRNVAILQIVFVYWM
jgi:MFS family permease